MDYTSISNGCMHFLPLNVAARAEPNILSVVRSYSQEMGVTLDARTGHKGDAPTGSCPALLRDALGEQSLGLGPDSQSHRRRR